LVNTVTSHTDASIVRQALFADRPSLDSTRAIAARIGFVGCEGVRVTEPKALGPALVAALKERMPTVIDVRTSMDVSFADITSPLATAARPS
jgi:hypothetical protein